MNMHQGHSHDSAPEEDAADAVLASRQQEFMLAGWHVRPAHQCITDGQQSRQLEPRLMTLLCLLAAHPGEVLNREDLMDSLWPRVVVNENSLTRAVSDLRRTLRDRSGTAFIETVPKKGYKLVAPVSCRIPDTRAEQQPAGEAAGKAGTEAGHPRGVMPWLRRQAAALAAINVTLAIALIGSFTPLMSSPDGDPALQPLSPVTRLATDTDSSPEGLINDVLREQRGEIIRGDDARPSVPAMTTARTDNPANAENTAGPAVSPDGELVAFTRRTDKGSTLLIGSMLDSSDPLQVYSSQHRIDHLQWSPVGTALLFSVLPTVSHAALGKQEEGRLMLFDLQDLSVRELYRSGHEPDDVPVRFNDALNIT